MSVKNVIKEWSRLQDENEGRDRGYEYYPLDQRKTPSELYLDRSSSSSPFAFALIFSSPECIRNIQGPKSISVPLPLPHVGLALRVLNRVYRTGRSRPNGLSREDTELGRRPPLTQRVNQYPAVSWAQDSIGEIRLWIDSSDPPLVWQETP